MHIVIAEVVPDALRVDFKRELVLADLTMAYCVLACVPSTASEPADNADPEVLGVLALLALHAE
jgi:hypothetical protein